MRPSREFPSGGRRRHGIRVSPDGQPAIGVQAPAGRRGAELVERLLNLRERDGLIHFLAACRTELEDLRCELPKREWEEFIDSAALTRLRDHFLDDPYTRRGLEKPRGYAGDAVLLDFIYGTAPLPDETTRTGMRIHKWMFEESDAFHAVRARRALAANYIDDAILKNPAARVLSIACGHLREMALCKFDKAFWYGELIAVDQDPRSLDVVSNSYGPVQVRARRLAVTSLLNGAAELGKFDLIYSMGLLDYLDDGLAASLADWCVRSLNPGGVLLLANFRQCPERGFMESVMRWSLTYRTAAQLSALVDPGAGSIRAFEDKDQIISFTTLTRHMAGCDDQRPIRKEPAT